MSALLVALLALLGVNLIVIVVYLGGVVARRRWLSHHAGAFRGIAHLVEGEAHGLGSRPRRGYGRWVRDVLVWTPAPLYVRNALIPVDRVESTRSAVGKAKRLGDHPQVVTLAAGPSRIDVTARGEDVALVSAPFVEAGGPTTNTTQ